MVLRVLVGGLECTHFIVSHSTMRYAPRHAVRLDPPLLRVRGMKRPCSVRGMRSGLTRPYSVRGMKRPCSVRGMRSLLLPTAPYCSLLLPTAPYCSLRSSCGRHAVVMRSSCGRHALRLDPPLLRKGHELLRHELLRHELLRHELLRHELLRHELLRLDPPLLRRGYVTYESCCLKGGILCVSVGVFVYSVVIHQSSTSVDPPSQNHNDGCVSSESSIQNNESINSVVIEGKNAQFIPALFIYSYELVSKFCDDSYSLYLCRFRVFLWRCPSHSYISTSPRSSASSKSNPSFTCDLFRTSRNDNIL